MEHLKQYEYLLGLLLDSEYFLGRVPTRTTPDRSDALSEAPKVVILCKKGRGHWHEPKTLTPQGVQSAIWLKSLPFVLQAA
ncbi:hypothetical protein ACLKA7_015502 [Drosophila subpalustris]